MVDFDRDDFKKDLRGFAAICEKWSLNLQENDLLERVSEASKAGKYAKIHPSLKLLDIQATFQKMVNPMLEQRQLPHLSKPFEFISTILCPDMSAGLKLHLSGVHCETIVKYASQMVAHDLNPVRSPSPPLRIEQYHSLQLYKDLYQAFEAKYLLDICQQKVTDLETLLKNKEQAGQNNQVQVEQLREEVVRLQWNANRVTELEEQLGECERNIQAKEATIKHLQEQLKYVTRTVKGLNDPAQLPHSMNVEDCLKGNLDAFLQSMQASPKMSITQQLESILAREGRPPSGGGARPPSGGGARPPSGGGARPPSGGARPPSAVEENREHDEDNFDINAPIVGPPTGGSFRPATGTTRSFHSQSKQHSFPSQQGLNKAPRFASPYF